MSDFESGEVINGKSFFETDSVILKISDYEKLKQENEKLKHYLKMTGLYDYGEYQDELKEENARMREALEKITDLHSEDGSIMQRYAYEALEKSEE